MLSRAELSPEPLGPPSPGSWTEAEPGGSCRAHGGHLAARGRAPHQVLRSGDQARSRGWGQVLGGALRSPFLPPGRPLPGPSLAASSFTLISSRRQSRLLGEVSPARLIHGKRPRDPPTRGSASSRCRGLGSKYLQPRRPLSICPSHSAPPW